MRALIVLALALALSGRVRQETEDAKLATVYDTPLDHRIIIVDGDDEATMEGLQ